MDSKSIECACGARFKLPADVAAGKRFKCTKCGVVLVVPGPTLAEKPVISSALLAEAAESAPRSSASKDCEYCGETILASAKKCKHCGEFLGDAAVVARPHKAAKATIDATDEPGPAEYVTALLSRRSVC